MSKDAPLTARQIAAQLNATVGTRKAAHILAAVLKRLKHMDRKQFVSNDEMFKIIEEETNRIMGK